DLGKVFDKSDFVKNLEKQVVGKFASNLPPGLSGLVVTASPETASLLAQIKSEVPPYLLNEVSAAITAETTLDSLQVPETADGINNLVTELEHSLNIALETQPLQVPIDEVIAQA